MNNPKSWAKTDSDMRTMVGTRTMLWTAIFETMAEETLEGKDILDFGCDQGGFLEALYSRYPYKSAIGVDIYEKAIELAQTRQDGFPVEYRPYKSLDELSETFDFAFSHEVFFLISPEDLKRHAKEMKSRLRAGGAYYAAMCGFAEHPLMSTIWQDLLPEHCSTEIYNHSINDVVRYFNAAGFNVSARLLKVNSFIPINLDDPYLPDTYQTLHTYDQSRVLFRITHA